MTLSGAGINRKKLVVTLTLLLPLLLLVSKVPDAHAASSTISGHVTDGITGLPLEDARVTVWEYEVPRRGTRFRVPTVTFRAMTTSGSDGRFEILVDGEFSCRVYVGYDDPLTPGYDYLPQVHSVSVTSGSIAELRCELVPAASILFEGDLLIVDSAQPPDSYAFTSRVTEEGLTGGNSILSYGTTRESHNQYVNVSAMHLLVPASRAVTIEVQASTAITHSFVIDIPQLASLGRGDAISLPIAQYSLPYNINLTADVIQRVAMHVNETASLGFYVLAEQRDLDQAAAFMESAKTKFTEGFFAACYTDLREVYTKAVYLDEKVQAMAFNASSSSGLIFLILALTSSSIAHLVAEQRVKQVGIMVLSYIAFSTLFYYMYAGARVLDTPSLLLFAGSVFLGALVVTVILPRLVTMAPFIIFSLAKRNLKRRRTRFTLTLTSVAVLVMSFVAFTSFSMEYGFTASTVGSITTASEGLLIRQPLPDIPPLTVETQLVTTFTPLPPSTLDWGETMPDVTVVAPKAENIPSRRPIGSLVSASQQRPIYGVLGLSPSDEAATSGFNNLLVAGQGRYLHDEEDAIMISARMASTLDTSVGDYVHLAFKDIMLDVQVVGFLDDRALQQLNDFDGSPMIPDKLTIVVEEGVLVEATIEPCQSSEIIVTTWQTAVQLSPLISLSRMDVLAPSVELVPFAREIALERDYWVWTADNGVVILQGIMSYLEAKGVTIIIPWLITITSVILTMLNAIYERRNEIGILSSVGLNPTHITALFSAEALIIGILGGGIGYLLGVSSYQLMPVLSLDLAVRQKISATWTIASLGIALTAVLVGAVAALRSSVILTPSQLRKWKAEGHQHQGPWVFTLPVRIPQEDVTAMLTHITQHLQTYKDTVNTSIARIEHVEERTTEHVQHRLSFRYCEKHSTTPFIGHTEIIALKQAEEPMFNVTLTCKVDQESHALTIAKFVRRLFLDWSVMRHEAS